MKKPRLEMARDCSKELSPVAYRLNYAGIWLATCPIKMSEWPFGALVSDATITSAPSSNGRWPNGVKVVLSTTTLAPAALALRMTTSRYQRSRPGFDGVSTKTRRTFLSGIVSSSHVGAEILRPIVRVTFWGALAMAVTAGIGAIVGTVV